MTTAVKRTDLAVYERLTRMDDAELVAGIRDLLGAKLTAYLGEVTETRTVRQWAEGERAIRSSVARERLRVAFIITRADAVGGATVHVRDVARGLADRGHEAIVLVGGRGEVLTEFDRAGVPYISLRWLDRSIQPFYDLRALFELKAALEQIRPNLVCAHTAKAGLLGRAAAALTGIPAIYTPHGWTIGDRISESSARFFRLLKLLRRQRKWVRPP